MTDHSRFVGDARDLKITHNTKPGTPREPRFSTTNLKLRELREHAGLTQEQVSEITGIRRAYISRLENSNDAKLSTIVSYLAAIGGSVEFVLEGRRETLQRVA